VRGAGLPVVLHVKGRVAPLPPGVDMSAYRIVQEALTNTLTHAGPANAEVRLRYVPGAIELEVSDDGAGNGTGGEAGGHGLVGMRERAAIYGGRPRHGAGAAGRRPGAGAHRLSHDPSTHAARGRPRGHAPPPRRAGRDHARPHPHHLRPRRVRLRRAARGRERFLLKDGPAEQLVAGIRTVAAGGALLAPTVTRRLIEELARVLSKLGLRDRTQAVVYAYESGIVRPEASG